MIVVFSTSSQQASVAVFSPSGELLFADRKEAPTSGGGTCLEMLRTFGVAPAEATGFVADVGPGSFTGVRVAVMLAKTLGWAVQVPVAGIASFDLIDPTGPVCLPARKGEWLCRRVGHRPEIISEFKGKGYGTDAPRRDLPDAALAQVSLKTLIWKSAAELMPEYILEPSISTPKKPYLRGAVR